MMERGRKQAGVVREKRLARGMRDSWKRGWGKRRIWGSRRQGNGGSAWEVEEGNLY